MPRKRAVALSQEIVAIEVKETGQLALAENDTLEEYKALNEKCDKVIVKIKNRKAKKK